MQRTIVEESSKILPYNVLFVILFALMSKNDGKIYDQFPAMVYMRTQDGSNDRFESFGTSIERICALFGGVKNFVDALQVVGVELTTSAIYRWRDEVDGKGGTGGMVPARYVPKVEEAARLNGILLPDDAFSPEIKLIRVREGGSWKDVKYKDKPNNPAELQRKRKKELKDEKKRNREAS